MKLIINGAEHEVDAPPDMPLLWALRDVVGLTGTNVQSRFCLRPGFLSAIPKVGVAGGSSAEVNVTPAPRRSYAPGISWSLKADATMRSGPPVHYAQCVFTGM